MSDLFDLQQADSASGVTNHDVFSRYFDPDLAVEQYPVPKTRAERLLIWRSYIDRLHGPAERLLNSRMSKFLKQQQKRFVRRINANASEKHHNSQGVVQKMLNL